MEITITNVAYGAMAVLTITLCGCATTAKDCDPAQGGYLKGIGCSTSGAYDQRQQARHAMLQQEQARKYQLQGKYRDTVVEQKSVRAKRGAANRRYASLRNDLANMESRLAKSKTGNPNLNQDLRELKSEASMLEQDTFTPEAEKAARLDRLMREKAALDREIEMALQL